MRTMLRKGSALQALLAAVAQKEGPARKLASELSGLAGVAVANQALAYDPDVVLLSGELFAGFLPDIRRFLQLTVPWPTNVQMGCLDEEGLQAGAVDMALLSAYEKMSRSLYADAPLRRAAAGA